MGMAFYCDDCDGYHTANECSVSDMRRTIATLRAELADADEQVRWFMKRCDWYNDQLMAAERALEKAEVLMDANQALTRSYEFYDRGRHALKEYRAARAVMKGGVRNER